MTSPDLRVRIGPLELENPILLASGCARYGEEIAQYLDLNRIGGIMVKGIALHPTPGNPPPRICETPAGMLNAIGLPNVGVETFIQEKLPFLRRFRTRVIVNIFGATVEEYAAVAARLDGTEGVHALEVNISCPNIREGGICFGTDPKATHAVVQAVRQATRLPVLVKLSPNVGDIVAFARACEEAGADGLSLINTVLGMAIDPETWETRLSIGTGGLSGPAIRPIAVRMVWEVARSGVRLPIVGMGGIATVEDAVEFFLAGAQAVALGTILFRDPRAPVRILEDLVAYLQRRGLSSLQDLVGKARYPGGKG